MRPNGGVSGGTISIQASPEEFAAASATTAPRFAEWCNQTFELSSGERSS